MSEKELKKIAESPYLDDNAKQIYINYRERFLKEKDEKEEKTLNQTLDCLSNEFVFKLA